MKKKWIRYVRVYFFSQSGSHDKNCKLILPYKEVTWYLKKHVSLNSKSDWRDKNYNQRKWQRLMRTWHEACKELLRLYYSAHNIRNEIIRCAPMATRLLRALALQNFASLQKFWISKSLCQLMLKNYANFPQIFAQSILGIMGTWLFGPITFCTFGTNLLFDNCAPSLIILLFPIRTWRNYLTTSIFLQSDYRDPYIGSGVSR